jgi:hypothetical protein
MANIRFTLGATSFAFESGPDYPINRPHKLNVVVAYSEGRKLYAYDKGIEERYFYLSLVNVSQNDFDNFTSFFRSAAVGPKNSFTFTDEDSVAHTVRIMDLENPLQETAPNVFSGTVTLREEV